MYRILIFSLILLTNVAHADYIWSENCKIAYDYSLKLNFNKAKDFLKKEASSNPHNYVTLYIESQIDFLNAFINENKTSLNILKINNEQRIKFLEKQTELSPYKKYFIADLNLQSAVCRIKFEEYIGAVYQIRSAFKLLEENQKEYPTFAPNLKSLGLIHAAVGSIPSTYSWATSLFGLTGTVNQGLGELRKLYAKINLDNNLEYLRDEINIILTFLELNIDKKNKNILAIRSRFYETKSILNKPLTLASKSIFHTSIGENDSVIYYLSNRIIDPESSELYYLDYMEGSARLYNIDFNSEVLLSKYVQDYKGNTYIKSAIQRLAWIELLKGNLSGYKTKISQCEKTIQGQNFTDEDKQAIKEAKNKIIPNVFLLKARLLFDGGYFNRALNELAGKPITNFPSQKDQLEFTYRLARIFEKLNKKDQAIAFYQSTIKNGSNYSYYFAANSSLLLGQLYESEGNLVLAKEYFEKTLSIRNHDYQNGIDQKAKAGLNRISEK